MIIDKISGDAHFHTGWKGRKDAIKWLISGKPPIPHIKIPITVGPLEIYVMGGGGSGSSKTSSKE